VDKLDELHHHARAALRIRCGPDLLGFNRGRHRGVDVGRRSHRNLRLHLAGAGVEDIGRAAGLSGDALPIDEVRDLRGHQFLRGAKRKGEGVLLGYPSNLPWTLATRVSLYPVCTASRPTISSSAPAPWVWRSSTRWCRRHQRAWCWSTATTSP